METKEYFEKVMQDFNQNGNGRSLRKYCQMEGVDYKWLVEYKKSYPKTHSSAEVAKSAADSFIPLLLDEAHDAPRQTWQVTSLRLSSPDGYFIEISSNNLAAVSSLLQSLSAPC